LCSLIYILFFTFISAAHAQKIIPEAVNELSIQITKHVTSAQKTKIAVVPFRELGARPTVLGTYISEELVTDLVNTGVLDLVERTTLDKVIGELKLDDSGAIDPATAKQVGKLLGAGAIVTGTITDLQYYVAVNCRLIDTETGRIFAAAETRIVKDDDVKKIMGISISSTQNSAYTTVDNAGRGTAKPPVFETESYRLRAEYLHKSNKNAVLTVGLESLSDKVTRFQIIRCYLLDENGDRWDAQTESAGFLEGIQMIPGTRVRSKYLFLAKDSTNGTRFSFICDEWAPDGRRKVVVPNITAQGN